MSENAKVRDPGLRAGGGRKARPEAGTEFRGACRRPGGNFKLPAAIDDGGVSSLLQVPAEPSGDDVRTTFRGVSLLPGGRFGAKIRDSKGKSHRWLGTFDTAEDAARAFDAAAVKIRGPAAITNFKQPAAVDDGGVSSPVHCRSIAHPAEPSGSQDAGTHFRGVSRLQGGKFGARIRDSKSQTWLGTFDTAEDAARAFDAAAVRIRGPAAITNFKQPAAIDDGGTHFRGVSVLQGGKFGARIRDSKSQKWLGTFDTAEDAARAFDAAAVRIHGPEAITNFKQPAAIDDDGGVSSLVRCNSIAQTCDWKGKAALSLGGFGSLPVHLPPAEWQQVDDLLKDIDCADDREALMEGAAILQHISLADMEMVGQNWAQLQ
ncbi:unnamed protein product [Alopecurus aequalis]